MWTYCIVCQLCGPTVLYASYVDLLYCMPVIWTYCIVCQLCGPKCIVCQLCGPKCIVPVMWTYCIVCQLCGPKCIVCQLCGPKCIVCQLCGPTVLYASYVDLSVLYASYVDHVKSLYRHFFLEDTSKHARVTQKWHFLICDKHNSKAPWATDPQIGVSVAKARSCDIVILLFF